MKRFILLLIVIAITIIFPLQQAAFADPLNATAPIAQNLPAAPNISAASAILMDAKNGQVLFSKNPNDRRPMASTTKMMTALVAIKHGNLDDVVTVGGDVVGPGSQGGIGLVPGEQVTLRDLLYALLLPSANDAAVAIADHIGGSVDGFATMMNSEAAAIGAQDTHFTNPHGLDDPMHYSTAHDLAIIAKTALQNPTFAQIVSTQAYNINRPSLGKVTLVKGHNNLLSSYSGATGVKTGYTRGAGNCLVSSAVRGDVSVISAVLGIDQRKDLFNQSATLLDYGFSSYRSIPLIAKGAVYKKIVLKDGRETDLVAANDVAAVVLASIPVTTETDSVVDVRQPVRKSANVGKVVVYQAGQPVAVSDLVAKENIEPLHPKPTHPKTQPATDTLTRPIVQPMIQPASFLLTQIIKKVITTPSQNSLNSLKPL